MSPGRPPCTPEGRAHEQPWQIGNWFASAQRNICDYKRQPRKVAAPLAKGRGDPCEGTRPTAAKCSEMLLYIFIPSIRQDFALANCPIINREFFWLSMA